jgi:uncharacterized protein involved in exopolysaccharide biosynthesis
MLDNGKAFPSEGSDEQIELLELILAAWNRRKSIAAASLICMALAGVYGFLIATPAYESSALLLPTQTSTTPDGLGAAAALLGKKGAAAGDVDLYQSLLTSRTVLRKLLKASIPNRSDTAQGRLESIASIYDIDTLKPKQVDRALTRIKKSILVGSKESGLGGILEVRFQAETPWLAKEIGDKVLQIGQEEIIVVRAQRADIILAKLDFAVQQAKSEWDSAATAATRYQEIHRSITSPEQRLDMARLEIEKAAKEQKYLMARREYELQQLEKAKAAPPMLLLDSASTPIYKIKPKRKLLLVVGLFVGFVLSLVYAIGAAAIEHLRRSHPGLARLTQATRHQPSPPTSP